MNYDIDFYREQVKLLRDYKWLNGKSKSIIDDVYLVHSGLNYIKFLLEETEKCGMPFRYPTVSDYYYQMAAHCLAAGLIMGEKFSREKLNEDSASAALELLKRSDTIVTAKRLYSIDAQKATDEDYSFTIESMLLNLEKVWNGKLDNKNDNIISMLLASFVAGVGADIDRYLPKKNETPYWRDESGKIRCLGDNCVIKECSEECPIWCNSLGIEMKHKELYDKAIVYFQKASVIAPDFKDIWANMGACYGIQGKYQEAYNSYKTAIEIDPIYKNALFGLAISSRDLGKPDESLSWCKKYDENYNDHGCDSIRESLAMKETNISDAHVSKDTKEAKYMFCRICGEKIPADSLFCNKCGTKVIKM